MKIALTGVILFWIGVAALPAQQPGISNEGDVRNTLAAIESHSQRLATFLDQVQPQNWTAHDVPAGYVTQANSSRNELQAVIASAKNLSRNPENLTGELELLIHVRTVESMLGSLSEGIRKYHNPAMADMLTSAVSENAGNRDRLQGYILELAKAKDQEFRVADQEAQRCRQSLSRDSVGPAKQGKR